MKHNLCHPSFIRVIRGESLSKSTRTGAILLEVVLALAMFFIVAGVVVGSLSAAASAVSRLRLQAEAADLAVSLMSEIQIGLVLAENSGVNQYSDDLADWTWQVVASPVEADLEPVPLTQVEVIIRHTPSGHTVRLVQLVPAADDAEAPPEEPL